MTESRIAKDLWLERGSRQKERGICMPKMHTGGVHGSVCLGGKSYVAPKVRV